MIFSAVIFNSIKSNFVSLDSNGIFNSLYIYTALMYSMKRFLK